MSVKAGFSISAEDRQKLIEGAFEAKGGAYSPHSRFPVGAALLTSEGRIIKGASVDNACYAANICAECTAIVKAVSEGIRSFAGLAVVGNVNRIISPCGICRQVLKEFCPVDMPIILVPGDYPQHLEPRQTQQDGYTEGGVKETTLGRLLPDSFGPEHLRQLEADNQLVSAI